VRRGSWRMRSVKVASQQTADQTFYYLIWRIKMLYLIENGKIQPSSAFQDGCWLWIRSSCNSGNSVYHALANAFVSAEIASGGVTKSLFFEW
jgi:hypothetical protein